MWNDKWSAEALSLFGRANFNPGSLMAASIGATAIGGGLSATGTLAGGNYAKTAGRMQQVAAEGRAQEMTLGTIGTTQKGMLKPRYRARRRLSLRESDIQRAVFDHLRWRGVPGVFASHVPQRVGSATGSRLPFSSKA